jgi:hypothetical protein
LSHRALLGRKLLNREIRPAFPGMASRSLVVLLALAPLAFATAIFATMGNFFAGHLMLLAGTAALVGGALHRYAPQ